jgi:hypothetical protein
MDVVTKEPTSKYLIFFTQESIVDKIYGEISQKREIAATKEPTIEVGFPNE